jgi:hypothetical protein
VFPIHNKQTEKNGMKVLESKEPKRILGLERAEGTR